MYYEDRLATKTDACREYACNVGADHPERAWILTDYDTWERNPHYHGPAVPHPEDDSGDYDLELSLEHDVPGRPAHRIGGFNLPECNPDWNWNESGDDIPF